MPKGVPGAIFLLLAHVLHVQSPGAAKGQGAAEKSKRVEIENALVICVIVGGLGDVNWAMGIGELLKEVSTAKVTYLFSEGTRYTESYLQKRSNFSCFEAISSVDEIGLGEDRAWWYGGPRKEGDNTERNPCLTEEDIEKLLKKCEVVVAFNLVLPGPQSLVREAPGGMCIHEYGDNDDNGARIFFRDYRKAYRDVVEEKEGHIGLGVGAPDFRSRLPEKKRQEFRLDYIGELERRIGGGEYYFLYYDSGSIDMHFNIIEGLLDITCSCIDACRPDSEKGRVIVLLSNIDPRKCIEKLVFFRKHGYIPLHPVLEADDNRKVDEMLATRKCRVDEKGETAEIEVGTSKVKMVMYKTLSPVEFEYLLLKSGRVAACTGDMSATQVLSSGRVIVYGTQPHKEDFYAALNARWREVLGEDPSLEPGTSSDLPVYEFDTCEYTNRPQFFSGKNAMAAYRRFLEGLQQDSFQTWFEQRLRALVGQN